jgi:CheY-like chemotaxis protein
VVDLDNMFEGKGFYRESSILLGGGAGTGKTAIAAHFAEAACRRGERCAFFSFEESPSQQEGSSRTCQVLVIDDSPYVADTFALLLTHLGATVRVANDGVSGLESFIDSKPDLVFLDLGLPGMDGYETARRIRRLPGGKDVMMIALTGWGGADVRKRTDECGFDRHLTKPVDIEHLAKILESSNITNMH